MSCAASPAALATRRDYRSNVPPSGRHPIREVAERTLQRFEWKSTADLCRRFGISRARLDTLRALDWPVFPDGIVVAGEAETFFRFLQVIRWERGVLAVRIFSNFYRIAVCADIEPIIKIYIIQWLIRFACSGHRPTLKVAAP